MKKDIKIGLALGAGAARGWGHIGVIKGLEALGIKPDIVCGASAGALVGAAYASGHVDALERWLRKLRRIDVFRLMDAKFSGGGFIHGRKLAKVLGGPLEDVNIEDLPIPFAAVATELDTGRERWLREGPVIDAVRASIAVPGLFSPVRHDDMWLVDGGLVNPVPVSICRAMGADIVIAVNVNGGLIGTSPYHDNASWYSRPEDADVPRSAEEDKQDNALQRLAARFQLRFKFKLPSLTSSASKQQTPAPGLLDVITASVNIVQDRITRSRMAGEPPDILLTPRLANIRLMEFDRAGEAIDEGLASVDRATDGLKALMAGFRGTTIEQS